MKLSELLDDLTMLERNVGGDTKVTDQAGHEIDRTMVDRDDDGTSTVVMVAR